MHLKSSFQRCIFADCVPNKSFYFVIKLHKQAVRSRINCLCSERCALHCTHVVLQWKAQSAPVFASSSWLWWRIYCNIYKNKPSSFFTFKINSDYSDTNELSNWPTDENHFFNLILWCFSHNVCKENQDQNCISDYFFTQIMNLTKNAVWERF